jgi:hypothetical protein
VAALFEPPEPDGPPIKPEIKSKYVGDYKNPYSMGQDAQGEGVGGVLSIENLYGLPSSLPVPSCGCKNMLAEMPNGPAPRKSRLGSVTVAVIGRRIVRAHQVNQCVGDRHAYGNSAAGWRVRQVTRLRER